MKNRTSFIIAFVVVILIFLFSNMIARATLKTVRVDLTDEKIYSLSKGTRNILDNLQNSITLKFYYSKTDAVAIPFIKNYAERVYDLLLEYKLYGKGNIKLEVYDPRPDTEEQEWAEKFGIQQIPLQIGISAYFGLAGLNEMGDEDIIPLFNPNRESFLEYDLTRLIYNLSNPEKKTIGLISPLPILGKKANQFAPPGPTNRQIDPWVFTKELQQIYNVKDLGVSVKKIPDGTDLLLVIHPKELSDSALFAIDQFVLGGGRLLMFADAFCDSDKPSHDPAKPYEAMMANRGSNPEKLLKTWGVELVKGKVAADRNIATKVNAGSGQILPFIVWLDFTEENIDKDDVITGKLESILLPYAGVLKSSETEGLTYTPILKTSKEASTLDSYNMGFSKPASLLENFTPGNEEIVTALRISGKFKTAFPDGEPATETETGEEASNNSGETLKESKKETNIILVSDADMLADAYSVRVQRFLGQTIMFPLNDNLNFVYNALENLSGSNDLISIRSRGIFARPFIKVLEIEREAEIRWKDEEKALVQKVNTINMRLKELMSEGTDKKKQLLSTAIKDEINKYRDERKNTQKRLREVRRKLREDKESLGNTLFVLNTFAMPLLICCFGLTLYIFKRRR